MPDNQVIEADRAREAAVRLITGNAFSCEYENGSPATVVARTIALSAVDVALRLDRAALRREACESVSPDKVACNLPAGHGGPHQAGPDEWPASLQQEATARGDEARVHGWTGNAEIPSGETVTFHAHADKPPTPETAAALQRIVEVAVEQLASGCICAGDELAAHCPAHDKDGIVTGEPASSQQEES